MKTFFRISMLLNLGLAAGLTFALLNGPKQVVAPAAPVVVVTRPMANEEVATAPPISPAATAKPFRWNQLESKNYPTYVKNLRDIGCPEPALRAIVSADVHAAYEFQFNSLEEKISALASGSWTNQLANMGTEEALKAELQKLPGEEAASINDLLGFKPALVAETDLATSDSPAEEAAPLPLIWQNIDPAALNLSSDQIQVINELRQSFLNEIGGLNQDSSDPAYLERWQKAQPEADEMLRGMLGTTVFQNYQLAAIGNEPSTTAAAKP